MLPATATIDNTHLFLPNGKILPVTASRPKSVAPQNWRRVSARYDSAETTRHNRKHWDSATSLSADAETNAHTRQILRDRSRYEVSNNTYAQGMGETIVNDVIGTGPRLQIELPDEILCKQIEKSWKSWAIAVDLPGKLRIMRMDIYQSGESFGIIGNNPRVEHDITLDLFLVEADQVTNGSFSAGNDSQQIDGITFDNYGNPVKYRVLKHHPGGTTYNSTTDCVTVMARDMIHYFKAKRPGQHRGIPEITAALPLFAQLRRYTLAVLDAAEAAADVSGVFYTDYPLNEEASDELQLGTEFELERNTFTTLAEGWKLGQIDAKQPTTTYPEFKKEVLNEAARCLNMPYNIAAGNSSGYNYSSGRLDFQTYFKSIFVQRSIIEIKILRRIFSQWIREYCLIHQISKYIERQIMELFAWFWDGSEHVDPKKEAEAQDIRLKNGTTTLAYEQSRQGRDWEETMRQRAREHKLEKELDLTEE
jgi:lambda family phage portal protein